MTIIKIDTIIKYDNSEVMKMDLIKILSNSTRMQIMQYMQIHGDSTTKQIAESLSDIPAPTLYRHINYLIDVGVLLIKEERKVRGSLERVLSFNSVKLSEDNDFSGAAYQFLFEIYSRFRNYAQKPDADPVKDKLAMRTSIYTLSDDEMDSLIHELGQVIEKYQSISEKSTGKKRSVSIIFAPGE